MYVQKPRRAKASVIRVLLGMVIPVQYINARARWQIACHYIRNESDGQEIGEASGPVEQRITANLIVCSMCSST